MNKRLNIIAAVVFVVLLGLVIVAGSKPNPVRRMQAAFLGLISPFLKSGSSVDRTVTQFREGMKTLQQLEEEVKTLRVSNRELSATNQTLRGLEAENNRLRNALGYRERSRFQLMSARVIARDASTWYNTVTIDRGSADGLEEDMPVVTEEGLVGKTTAISEHSSIVTLISDERCKVAALVEGTREQQGIVQGERNSSTTTPIVALSFLSKQASLKPGDKVVTSGAGGVFPPKIALGAIREFKVRELDGYATLIPAVDLTSLEDLFVVVSDSK